MADRYWVGGSGTWNTTSTTNWSATSGGAGGASAPTSVDNVFFDANSGSGTVTISVGVACNQFTSTGFVGVINSIAPANSLFISGNITVGSSTVWGTGWVGKNIFFSNANKNVDFGGVTFPGNIRVTQTASTATLTNNLTINGQLRISEGTFNAATYNVNASEVLNLTGSGTTISLGSGTWTLSSTSSPWSVASGITINAGTSTIVLSNVEANTVRVFSGGGVTYNNLVIGGTVEANAVTQISGSNTFNTLSYTIPGTHEIRFQASTTTTVTNFDVSGSTGNYIAIRSSSSGTRATLRKTSGTVTTSFLDIRDSAATGGAVWNTSRSINSGNNTGWIFLSTDVFVNAVGLSSTGRVGNVTIISNIELVFPTGVQGTASAGVVDVITANPVLPLGYNVILIPTLGASTWTVPADWNPANNKIECIGSGQNGSFVSSFSGRGGTGGAYASISNVNLTPGSTIYINVGASNSTADTWVNLAANTPPASTAQGVLAKSGRNGGLASGSVGTLRYNGGVGGTAPRAGGGGGGAAGPLGAGRNGGGGSPFPNGGGGGGGGGANGGTAGDGGVASAGANGGNSGTGAIGGVGGNVGISPGLGVDGSGGGGGRENAQAGARGGSGYTTYIGGNFNTNTPFNGLILAGPGGGGGGNGRDISTVQNNGGVYGGGGGSVSTSTSSLNGAGGQGLVVITYAPPYITNNINGFQANTSLGKVAVWITIDDRQADGWQSVQTLQI